MLYFRILRILGGNRKNEENWKIWAKIGLLRYSVGNPCHSIGLRQGVGYRHRGKGLRCGVATVHNEQFLDLVSEHLVFVHR